MLLINICVLAGAILTPPSLRWMYSTHIVLLCLYQLRCKNWQSLVLIAISLVCLFLHQVWEEPKASQIDKSEVLWVQEATCFVQQGGFSVSRILIRLRSASHYVDRCPKDISIPSTAHAIHLVRADLQGDWRQRYAYAKGVDGIAYLDDETLAKSDDALADYFARFSSWPFAYSIVKGDRSLWTERDRWLVNYLGIGHLFVVSGLHVGFISILVIWVVGRMWRIWFALGGSSLIRRSCLEFALASPSCALYAYWVGGGEPVMRAVLMAVILLGSRAYFQSLSVLKVLLLSAWLMLLAWPGRLLDASFWLSFCFVGLLVLLMPRMPAFGKAIYFQVLLSSFGVLLTLGWQTQVSVLVLLVNLVLIPFVAFVWFPAVLLSLVEYHLYQKSYLYTYLDPILSNIYYWLEPCIYQAPSVSLEAGVTVAMKLLCIVLAFIGVLSLPLIRGWLLIALVVCSVVMDFKGRNYERIWIGSHGAVLEQRANQARDHIRYIEGSNIAGKTFIVNPSQKRLAQKVINSDWQVAVLSRDDSRAKLLQALSVKTVLITEGERFTFRHVNDNWQVESSNCYRILNLMKTVACEHAEILESVLN